MQAASLADIKRELKTKDHTEAMELCLRLARFKKDNKELLTYLLFEASDEEAYASSLKDFIEDSFAEINTSNLYYAKKGLRKVLRNVSRMIRYSGNKQTEVEVLIHFCIVLKNSSIDISGSVQLTNLFERQVEKIKKAMGYLHEDLQADYDYEIEKLGRR